MQTVMSDSQVDFRQPSLRASVLAACGQDVRRCKNCWLCDEAMIGDQDITFGMLVQLTLLNDAEVLTSRTLWSDEVLQAAQRACTSGLNLSAVMLALRAEAQRRDQIGTEKDQHEVSD